MARQHEPGTQNPLRPAVARYEAEGAFALPVDGAATWTTGNKRIPIDITSRQMDDRDVFTVSAFDYPAIRAGQYLIEFHPTITEDGSADKSIKLAITNITGTTVYAESGFIGIPADSTGTACYLSAVVHLTADDEIRFRATQTSATASTDIRDAEPVATITRIGNANES